MLIRIVKLTFEPDKVEEFLNFFDTVKDKVNNFPGCTGMKLLQDMAHPNIIMTYSHWEHPSDLENYRTSETFQQIWSTIKPSFSEKAQAWSVTPYFDGFEFK